MGTNKPDVTRFLTLLDDFGLIQHVTQPTHNHNHILDLVITRYAENIISDIRIKQPCLSDHNAILFDIIVQKPKLLKKTIQYRNWKSDDLLSFSNDLTNS